MFRAFRFIVDLFTQRHGIIAFVFFLLVGLLMRQMYVVPFQEFSTLEEVFVMEKEPDWIIRELLDD